MKKIYRTKMKRKKTFQGRTRDVSVWNFQPTTDIENYDPFVIKIDRSTGHLIPRSSHKNRLLPSRRKTKKKAVGVVMTALVFRTRLSPTGAAKLPKKLPLGGGSTIHCSYCLKNMYHSSTTTRILIFLQFEIVFKVSMPPDTFIRFGFISNSLSESFSQNSDDDRIKDKSMFGTAHCQPHHPTRTELRN